VITPLLFLVLFGTIEFGRMIVSREMLAYSTIEGARTAAVLGTATVADVQAQVTAAAPLLTLTSVDVTNVSNAGAGFAGRAAGDVIQVQTTYTFTPVINLGGLGTKTWIDTQQAVAQ
jgi:Flp pilus assembly protein TadG